LEKRPQLTRNLEWRVTVVVGSVGRRGLLVDLNIRAREDADLTGTGRFALPPLSVHVLSNSDVVVRLERKIAGIVGVVGVQSGRLSKRWVVRLWGRTGRRAVGRRSGGRGLRLVVAVVSLLVIAVVLLAVAVV
jgi:hypothetical protein